jgi:uncharacterized protein (DUF952 family)
MHIYKILTEPQWQDMQSTGVYQPSPDDQRDGFVHLSSAAQLSGTIDKYYSDIWPIFVLQIDAIAVSDGLKWEVSRAGDKFPHYYGEMTVSMIEKQIQLDMIEARDAFLAGLNNDR